MLQWILYNFSFLKTPIINSLHNTKITQNQIITYNELQHQMKTSIKPIVMKLQEPIEKLMVLEKDGSLTTFVYTSTWLIVIQTKHLDCA